MTISPYSRYADDTVSAVLGTDGITRSTIIISPPDEPVTYTIQYFTWQNGDQIEYLSYNAYGDETQWWRIANANPQILFWDSIANGTQIRVPNA